MGGGVGRIDAKMDGGMVVPAGGECGDTGDVGWMANGICAHTRGSAARGASIMGGVASTGNVAAG